MVFPHHLSQFVFIYNVINVIKNSLLTKTERHRHGYFFDNQIIGDFNYHTYNKYVVNNFKCNQVEYNRLIT